MYVKKYRGGGMSSDPRASKLAKMMQAYRNGGYVYAQNGGRVSRQQKQTQKAQAAGSNRVPEGLDYGSVYFDPEAGSFYSVVSQGGEKYGRPFNPHELGSFMRQVEKAAEERGGLDRRENVFGYVTHGDVERQRGSDDPLLQIEAEGSPSAYYPSGSQHNPYAKAASYTNLPSGESRSGKTTMAGYQNAIKDILQEALRAGDAEQVSRIMGTVMNPEFSDIIPGLTPMTYEGTGFQGYWGDEDDLLPTRETKTVEPRTKDLLNYLAGNRRGPGSFPGQ